MIVRITTSICMSIPTSKIERSIRICIRGQLTVSSIIFTTHSSCTTIAVKSYNMTGLPLGVESEIRTEIINLGIVITNPSPVRRSIPTIKSISIPRETIHGQLIAYATDFGRNRAASTICGKCDRCKSCTWIRAPLGIQAICNVCQANLISRRIGHTGSVRIRVPTNKMKTCFCKSVRSNHNRLNIKSVLHIRRTSTVRRIPIIINTRIWCPRRSEYQILSDRNRLAWRV